MSDQPTPQQPTDADLPPLTAAEMPPQLAEVLARMSLRGPVVDQSTKQIVAEGGRLVTDQPDPAVLPPRADWEGNERPATAAEVARAEATAARIRREVAEIRTAAERLEGGSPFAVAVAEFLTVQATLLERHGGTAERAESLSRYDDTRDDPDTFPSAARSALLIARAALGIR
ncbi:hypothetical protein ABZ468_08170 [Streptomyces sp. NPDC005708]|uniref:hypothetical protein n=1 Tax=Streptomyces sp. NPDC005708 TaxID=3154564 RepID=UPI0033D4700B